jgi:hypothetical protein
VCLRPRAQINAYYALQLLGDALAHDEMRTVGQLATMSEIHSAQTYWHMDDSNIVYPPALREKRMLGILWQNLAQYQTWFGGLAFMVHGIQMIPITPISELTQPAAFTEVEYPVFAQSCGGGGQCLTDGWITFQVMAHAILSPVRDTAARHSPACLLCPPVRRSRALSLALALARCPESASTRARLCLCLALAPSLTSRPLPRLYPGARAARRRRGRSRRSSRIRSSRASRPQAMATLAPTPCTGS